MPPVRPVHQNDQLIMFLSLSPSYLSSQHYCWLESTFSVSDGTAKTVGIDVAYPGVKTLNAANGERKVHHKYYQWVYFILILQVCTVFFLNFFLFYFCCPLSVRRSVSSFRQTRCHLASRRPLKRPHRTDDNLKIER